MKTSALVLGCSLLFACEGMQQPDPNAPGSGVPGAGGLAAANVCEPSCRTMLFNPSLCVLRGDRCEECTTDAHCTGNPLSHGPRCNTSDIAGTGVNFCVCENDAECESTRIGTRCLFTPSGTNDPTFKQCGCRTDEDCVEIDMVCIGGTGDIKFPGKCARLDFTDPADKAAQSCPSS